MIDDHTQQKNTYTGMEVAIIGMACRLPGASNKHEFWKNLHDGVESITFFSDEQLAEAGVDPQLIADPDFVKAGQFYPDLEKFDAAFFGLSPLEARVLDPQHRHYFEVAWETFEDAAYNPETYDGVIGHFLGVGPNTYRARNLDPNRARLASVTGYELMIANQGEYLPSRVAYKFNLRGPSLNIQSACSTGLVVVHTACQSILNGECDMALAGAVSIRPMPALGYLYQVGMIFSPDGHNRSFDGGSRGTIQTDGLGAVLLKRLEDAMEDRDSILAVIKGTAINNDGSLKPGYTAPGVEGQSQVVKEAMEVGQVDPATVSFVEAHGTATELGDPVEAAGLVKAFPASHQQYCALGSVKSNLGHLGIASGMAGLIKTVLMLQHRSLVPSLHFHKLNPQINFNNSPFYVNTQTKPWQPQGGSLLRAGVSSLGLGGTNAHVVLEEAPHRQPPPQAEKPLLIPLSAHSLRALEETTDRLADHLKAAGNLNSADVAFTLQQGRKHFPYRRLVVCNHHHEAGELLADRVEEHLVDIHNAGGKPTVAFMLMGHGSHYVGMGHQLYKTEPHFAAAIDACAAYLKGKLEYDLTTIMFAEADDDTARALLRENEYAHLATFVFQYALSQWWRAQGVEPSAMVSLSLGEYVAAAIAGVFTWQEAIDLILARAQLVANLPPGCMLAVPLPEEEVLNRMPKECSLSAVNGPDLCVIAGAEPVVAQFKLKLEGEGISPSMVPTTHAFHSHMMDPIVAPFVARVRTLTLKKPKIPFISTVSGTWVDANEVAEPSYWGRHLRETIRFADGLSTLFEDKNRICLDLGPKPTLTKLARGHHAWDEHAVYGSMPTPDGALSERAALYRSLGACILHGLSLSWPQSEGAGRVSLPGIVFQRRRYWVDAPEGTTHDLPPSHLEDPTLFLDEDPDLQDQDLQVEDTSIEGQLTRMFRQFTGIRKVDRDGHFFHMGGTSLGAIQLITRLNRIFGCRLSHHDLLRCPTVNQLAEVVRTEAAEPDHQDTTRPPREDSCLVAFRQGCSSLTPLFLVHPAGGHIFLLRELADQIDKNRDVYGFEAMGVDRSCLRSVEALAKHYLSVLRSVQPKGPYLLAGASYGGAVAFEMARQLQIKGETQTTVYMMDTPNPEESEGPPESAELRYYLLWESSGKTPDRQGFLALSETAQINQLKQHLGSDDPSHVHQLTSVYGANLDALARYRPQSTKATLHYLRAQDSPGDLDRGWHRYASAGFSATLIEGNHTSMNQGPGAKRIAALINASHNLETTDNNTA